jgi:integrase
MKAEPDEDPARLHASFNHFVGALLKVHRHVEAKRRGGLEVDHQLELGRLFDREIGWICPAQDLGDLPRPKPENPVAVDIPAHPDLLATIAATPSKHLTFLITDYRKPFTPAGFGNAMRDWCDQANLHHCSAHGLRKACATALAEAGATSHEIAAVTGHQSLEEIERYTRTAERKRLADQAMKKFKARTLSVPLDCQWDN